MEARLELATHGLCLTGTYNIQHSTFNTHSTYDHHFLWHWVQRGKPFLGGLGIIVGLGIRIGLDWIYVGNTPLPAPQTSRFAWFWYAIGTIRQVLMWIMFFFFRSPLFCFCAFFSFSSITFRRFIYSEECSCLWDVWIYR